jgi:hypothetical protein
MKCPKCGRENEDNALYCSQCGTGLGTKKTDWPNVLLLAYCGSMLFFSIVFAILGYVKQNSSIDWHLMTYLTAIFGIAQALTTIIVPMGMTKVSLKTIAFILVALSVVITIITLVQTITQTANLEY